MPVFMFVYLFVCSYHGFVRGEICMGKLVMSFPSVPQSGFLFYFNKSDDSDGVVTKDCQSKLIKLHPYGP